MIETMIFVGLAFVVGLTVGKTVGRLEASQAAREVSQRTHTALVTICKVLDRHNLNDEVNQALDACGLTWFKPEDRNHG